MTQAPATGLWGPELTVPETGLYGSGDYEGYQTIDMLILLEDQADRLCQRDRQSEYEIELFRRSAVVDTLITLAHDLDARGLVVVPEVATQAMQQAGGIALVNAGLGDVNSSDAEECHAAMVAIGATEFPPLPPDPNTGS